MSDELPGRLDQILVPLTRETALTPESIRSWSVAAEFPREITKRKFDFLIRAANLYRSGGRLSKLRVLTLVGTTLAGRKFISAAERSGLFLSDERFPKKFGEFLADLKCETSGITDPLWAALDKRLSTYCSYHQFAAAIRGDGRKALRLLRSRPRYIVKEILAFTNLVFLRHYLGFKIAHGYADWLEELGSPEEVASAASVLVARANEFGPLDSYDLALPSIETLDAREMRLLMRYGNAVMQRHEVAKDISLFGYRLESHRCGGRKVFYLRPPSPELEYAIRLGFVRAEMGWGSIVSELTEQREVPRLSLLGAAKVFADKFHKDLIDIRDLGTPYRRVRLKIPKAPHLYQSIIESTFYDDLELQERLSQDFLFPLRYKTDPELRLTDNLDLQAFYRIWKHLRFLSLVDISILRRFDAGDPTILFNSIVRVMPERELLDMIMAMGACEETAHDFLNLVCADVRHLGFLDLQYTPFLRIATTTIRKRNYTSRPEVVFLPALVYASNELRNVQAANRIRVGSNAKLFVDAVGNTLGVHFKKLALNRPIELKGRRSDVDVVIFEGKNLYIFECKHSVPSTGAHEMRDLWEDIEKGAEQLRLATQVLGDKNRLLGYMAGWFPGTKKRDVADLAIRPCILCSHRIYSGMDYEGIPVRDFSSLSKLCSDGIVGIGHLEEDGQCNMLRFKITGDQFSSKDLDDYLSSESTFFKMFAPFMHPVSRLKSLGKVTVARETYLYEVQLGHWIAHLQELGCVRQADKRKVLSAPLPPDKLA